MLRRLLAFTVLPLCILLSLACSKKPKQSLDQYPYIIPPSQGSIQFVAISGKVTDLDGRPLPGAKVIVSGKSLYREFSVLTSGEGRYLIEGLPLNSRYSICVEARGYNKVCQITSLPINSEESGINFSIMKTGNEILLVDPPPIIDIRSTTTGVVVKNDDNGLPRVENK